MVINRAAMLACCYRPQQRSRDRGGSGLGIRLDVQALRCEKGSVVMRRLRASFVAS